MKSHALGRQVSYSITIPEAWNAGPGPYSVLYQLHGGSDDHMVWLAYSNLVRYASKCQLPIIIVMPDGANSYWLNIDENQRYEDFLIEDLPAHIMNTYNAKPGKAAIGGESMGGYGAMRLALRYPTLFSSVWSHSAAFWTRERLVGHHPLLADAPDSDIFEVAAKAQGAELPVIGFDCGQDDFMIRHNRRFHEHLRDLGIVHTYNEHPGIHNWDYWDLHVKDALEQHARVLSYTVEVENEAT